MSKWNVSVKQKMIVIQELFCANVLWKAYFEHNLELINVIGRMFRFAGWNAIGLQHRCFKEA